MKYLAKFIHPKYGEQENEKNTKNDILKWLSYMVYAHSITNIKLFEDGKEIKNFKIPKW